MAPHRHALLKPALRSDKVDDRTIRLTLLRSPGTDAGYTDQGNQDWGHREITFAIAGHRGTWRDAGTDWQGYRLNNPIRAFATTPHRRPLGKRMSLSPVNTKHVRLFAMKKAEDSNEIVDTNEGLNVPYQYSYLYAYSTDIFAGAKTLTLPRNTDVKVLAISVARVPPQVTPAAPLFDTLRHTAPPMEK